MDDFTSRNGHVCTVVGDETTISSGIILDSSFLGERSL